MNSPEERLRKLPRIPPPLRLDASIEAVLREAAARSPSWYRRPVPLWGVLAGCMAGGVIGALLSQPSTREPVWLPTVVYEVPLAPEMRRAFGIEEPKVAPTFFSQPRTIVEFSGVPLPQSEL